jgi:hypothetical protein
MRLFRLSITLGAVLLIAQAAAATTVGGIELPLTQGDFHLQGAGLLRKGWFFKVYVGALYLKDGADAGNILGHVPKRLDIHFFHYTPKKHMIRVAEKTLRKNLSEETYRRLLPHIQKLHDAYLDGKKGSCASIIYLPGEGLSYYFDNQPIITIDCDDFANAYFTIWLGEHPSSRTVKMGMLNDD